MHKWLLFLLLLIPSTSKAIEYTPALREAVASAWILAYGQVGYELGIKFNELRPPEVEFITQGRLCQIVFGTEQEFVECGVNGATHSQTLKVYLREDLDPVNNVVHFSIVVHEFVHMMQFTSGDNKITCADWYRREQQAYTAQAHVLEKMHGDIRVLESGRKRSLEYYIICKDKLGK